MTFNARTYQPPGPVGEAFLRSRAPVRFIMGPFGSGKTHLALFDGQACAALMPKCIDGVRRFRGLVFRDTYGKLWDTVIPSWWQWYPESVGRWSGQKGRLGDHLLRFDQPDGGTLEFHMQFRALDEHHDIEDAMKGVEPTWALLNEADTLNEEVLTYILGRVQQKRFPPHRMLPASAFRLNPETGEREPAHFAGVVGDLNPPDVDNYVYQLFEEKKPFGHVLFKQPSGRSPRGENRQGVSRQAYLDMAALNAHRPWWVKRMVDGQYGPSRDGLPVYADENNPLAGWNEDVHLAEEKLAPLAGLPLRLSFDPGVTGPCMLISQRTHFNQLRYLDEVAPARRMTATPFAQLCKTVLEERYRGFQIRQPAVCDMAGFAGGDKERGDLAWADTIANILGVALIPCLTNEIGARIDVVWQRLEYFPEGQAALLVSRRCKQLRKGFNSHYRYKTDKTGENKDPVPDKNRWSNPHDALQYDVLDCDGIRGVLDRVPLHERGRKTKPLGPRRSLPPGDDDDEDEPVKSRTEFNVFKV